MPTKDEHYAVLKDKVTFNGAPSDAHARALAGQYAETQIPTEHVSRIAAFHTGSDSYGYHPSSGVVSIPGDPTRDNGPALRGHQVRRLAHETGHAVQHQLNGDRVPNMMRSQRGRGMLEGNAERYADRAVPGSHSGYDYEVHKGSRGAEFSSGYKTARGDMYPNIDPRLKG